MIQCALGRVSQKGDRRAIRCLFCFQAEERGQNSFQNDILRPFLNLVISECSAMVLKVTTDCFVLLASENLASELR